MKSYAFDNEDKCRYEMNIEFYLSFFNIDIYIVYIISFKNKDYIKIILIIISLLLKKSFQYS